MAQIPVLLDAPADIFLGIEKGIYTISGGTVRNSAGKIVKLLKDATPTKQDELKALDGIAATMLKYKWIAIASGAIIITGAVIYFTRKFKSKNTLKREIPECISIFKNSFYAYLDAARKGTLEVETINELLESIDMLEINSKGDKVILDFSGEEFKTLMNQIIDYTRKLAQYTSYTINQTDGAHSDNMLIDLREHLKLQKQIIENVA